MKKFNDGFIFNFNKRALFNIAKELKQDSESAGKMIVDQLEVEKKL